MKVFKPIIFQGNLNKTRYFEGWYFKQISENLENVISIIPGIALSENDKHSFIQVINGINGKTWNITYPVSAFKASKNKFYVEIGDSRFSENEIQLNIESKDLHLKGSLYFSKIVKYPTTKFSPGIMGWYSFVPFMECKHGIGSVMHNLHGKLRLNNSEINFNEGKGYIEKDWGTSFPESWIWLHCNTFSEANCSFTFSVAKIPWLSNFFIGHICFLYLKGKFYLFATYNNSKITKLKFNAPKLEITLENKNHLLQVEAVQNQSGTLKAPVTGNMDRIIKESVDSEIKLQLFNKQGKLLFSTEGKRAGLEIIEKILAYF